MKNLGPTKHAVVTCLWCKKKFKASFIRNAPTTHNGKCKILHRKHNAKIWNEKNKHKRRAYEAAYRARHAGVYRQEEPIFESANESLLIR